MMWVEENLRTINFVLFYIFFIDVHPRKVNAIMALCYRCLLGGRLIGLAFDPLACNEG